jgi:hypothetical protein
MDTSQPTIANFLQHLLTDNQPFILRRDAAPPQGSDEALHMSNKAQFLPGAPASCFRWLGVRFPPSAFQENTSTNAAKNFSKLR